MTHPNTTALTIRLLAKLLLIAAILAAMADILAPKITELVTQTIQDTTFHSSTRTVSSNERTAMLRTKTWRSGCPLPISKLRVITVSYWGFDGQAHIGKMMVNASVTSKAIKVFHELFKARYEIHQMRLVQDFGGRDEASMLADNSSSYNCRRSPIDGTWSYHAYGLAIDINPLENPEVLDHTRVDPPSSRRYLNRSLHVKSIIRPNDAAVRAFSGVGWKWGGTWAAGWQDWQHFYTAEPKYKLPTSNSE